MYQVSLYRERLKDVAAIKKDLTELFESLYDDVDHQLVYGFVTPEEKDSIRHMLQVEIDLFTDAHFKAVEKLQRMKNLFH